MNISHRTLLAAPLALPVTLCAATSLAAPTGVSPALAQLIAAYAAADAEYDRFCEEVHSPAVKRQDAMIAAMPHFEIDASLAGDGSRMWSTATGGIAEARGIATMPMHLHSQRPDWQDKVRRARTFTAAYVRRQRAIDRTHRSCGLEAIEPQEADICARLDSIRRAIFEFVVRTPADLRAKLDALDDWLTAAEFKSLTLGALNSIQSQEA